MQPQKPDEI